MDASRTLKAKNNKGAVVIFVALVLIFIVSAILLLAVDFSFMYVNKAKLQNAADAGALAGAGRLIASPAQFRVYSSGDTANRFARYNFPPPVTDDSVNLNQSNAPDGDIVMGVWNSNTREFTAHPSSLPTLDAYSTVNAVKVTVRKTGQTGTGMGTDQKFPLFFGKFFGSIFNFTDTATMGAKASAIAWRPPRARTYLLINYSAACKGAVSKQATPSNTNMAWSSLSPTTPADANTVKDLFCATVPPFIDACNTSINTSNGMENSAFGALMIDFYDPNYDRGQKTFGADGSVATWDVVVPYTSAIDPTASPRKWPVIGYAEILLTNACGSGGLGLCQAENRVAVNATRCSSSDKYFDFNRIRCVTCSNVNSMIGAIPQLCK